MSSLKPYAEYPSKWTLDEFVAVVNEVLPTILPSEMASRIKDEVTSRLVRHYAGLGMISQPLKEGREARYEYQHLLQLLVVRKLLAEGLTANAVGDLAKRKDIHELEALLQGGTQVNVTAANPALEFIERIRRGNTSAPQTHPAPAPPVPREGGTWTRFTLLPGLELHVRDDLKVPTSLQEQRALSERINQTLVAISQRRKI